jgi:uncharacterized protein
VRAAALLHDAEPPANELRVSHTRLEHHVSSAEYAAGVLQSEGWPQERIDAVSHCIRAHRFRDQREPPQTIEAKALFDADKLDAIGAVGVARAIAYAVNAGQPPFAQVSQRFRETGELEDGEPHSACHEFVVKLSKLRDRMQTQTGRLLAEERHRFMVDFFERLEQEAAYPEDGNLTVL